MVLLVGIDGSREGEEHDRYNCTLLKGKYMHMLYMYMYMYRSTTVTTARCPGCSPS